MEINHRKKVPFDLVEEEMAYLLKRIIERIEQYGDHTFSSRHEILGLVTEEFNELQDSIGNKSLGRWDEFREELIDLAVACVFGAACITNRSLDW